MTCSLTSNSLKKLLILLRATKHYHSHLNKSYLGNIKILGRIKPHLANLDNYVKFASSGQFDSSSQVCWKCGVQRKDVSKVFCEECNVVQNPNDIGNYFKVFNMDEKFDIDHKALREMYRKLQTALHPDKFSNKSEEEKVISTNYSSLVNKAYSSLQVPLKRAEHLLQLKGNLIDEKQSLDNPEFLMEMMELNEEMENVTTSEKLKDLNIKNKNILEKIAREIDDCFQKNDLDRAKECIIRMKYYSSLGHRINNMLREKGIVD